MSIVPSIVQVKSEAELQKIIASQKDIKDPDEKELDEIITNNLKETKGD